MAGVKYWPICVAVASALMFSQMARAEDDLGYQAIRSHDWATAEKLLLEGLQKDPRNSSRQLNLAFVYAQTGRKAEAAALYSEILKRDEDRVASLSPSSGNSVAVLARRGLARLKDR